MLETNKLYYFHFFKKNKIRLCNADELFSLLKVIPFGVPFEKYFNKVGMVILMYQIQNLFCTCLIKHAFCKLFIKRHVKILVEHSQESVCYIILISLIVGFQVAMFSKGSIVDRQHVNSRRTLNIRPFSVLGMDYSRENKVRLVFFLRFY